MNLSHLVPACVALLNLAACAQSSPPPASGGTNVSGYPRINLAPSYEVDPAWPRRPSDVPCGHVPGLAVDDHDNVWIYTRTNPTVQVFGSDGKYLRTWLREVPKGVAHSIRFDRDRSVWLADIGLHTVRKFSQDGTLLLTLGTPGQAGVDATHFNRPTDVTFAPNGDIFVADGYGNSRVVRFDKTGRFVKSWGSLGVEPGQFSIPHAITCDSQGRLYVADRNNVRIQVFDQEGNLLDVWQNILVPWNFWISATDELWVCGSSPMTWVVDPKYPTAPLGCPPKDQLFMKFSTAGKVLQLWTLPKGEDGKERPGELNWVHSIALDSKGNVYLGDIVGRRAQKFLLRR